MKKTSIGIFASVTAILFLLSMSLSVTAATHSQTLVELGSYVDDSTPYADVSVTPRDVWSYSDWTWTLDINNGDTIVIRTYCEWGNSEPGGGGDTGEHYFWVIADYSDPPTYDNDDDNADNTTSDGLSDSFYLVVSFTNCQEGAQIDFTWFVSAKNLYRSSYVESQPTGTLYIT